MIHTLRVLCCPVLLDWQSFCSVRPRVWQYHLSPQPSSACHHSCSILTAGKETRKLSLLPKGHIRFMHHHINFDAKSWFCIDADTTLPQHHVPAGYFSKSQKERIYKSPFTAMFIIAQFCIQHSLIAGPQKCLLIDYTFWAFFHIIHTFFFKYNISWSNMDSAFDPGYSVILRLWCIPSLSRHCFWGQS